MASEKEYGPIEFPKSSLLHITWKNLSFKSGLTLKKSVTKQFAILLNSPS